MIEQSDLNIINHISVDNTLIHMFTVLISISNYFILIAYRSFLIQSRPPVDNSVYFSAEWIVDLVKLKI